MDIKGKIIKVIVEQLGVREEDVKDNARFVEDLGVDSLDAVELVVALEDEFGIEIPDEDAEEAKTVKEVIDYLSKKLVQEGKGYGSIL